MVRKFDFLVIGSGLAGMSFALKVAHKGTVALICKAGLEEANTYFAQGGIASVTNLAVDNFEKHIEDTMIAGDWISDREAVEKVVRNAPEQIKELIKWGVNFDKKEDGEFDLHKEGGHSEFRILHHKDNTGFWDTFRCLFPLLNLMYPSVNKEMQEGLINTYKESGFFPEWASPGHRGCMVGNNSASILVDAYMKGVKVNDIKTLYEGLIHGTENVHPEVSSTGRLGYEYYNKLGYVPYDVKINENAARTLEYAYDDWCIYRLAKELKRPKKEINLFAKRAMNYKNLFDKESKLMRGRNEDGTFQSPFSPLKWGDAFTEGNSWHYTWSVFHDPQGLIDLMGGKEMFVTMMDSVFAVPPIFDDSYYGQVIHEIREMTVMNMGNYAHGNQPIQHMIYLYDYAGQPWKAQYWLRQVMDRMYTPGPDGYCGDEDNGQTSAWYVFSALGFYPVCPGTDEYVMGTPLFKKATLHFENGNSLVIDAPNNSTENFYIDSMNFNGADHTKNYLRHEDLFKGGTIKVDMSNRPNLNRGTKEEDMPYSFSKE